MAAPADSPEFKGNVAAVQTAPYWEYLTPIETKLSVLHEMKMKLQFKDPKHANKDGKMTKAQQEAYLKDYNAKVVRLTPKEEAFYKRVTSNSGMHYFGSAKIVGQIGKAFAQAMLKM
jgi:alpha-galactosidase